MGTVWFCLLGWLLATYVVLDGLDIGTGIIHLFVARTEEERERVLKTIGPLWDGNEVCLLAAGGTMFFAFPKLLAVSFSGFYLPLMMVLWLLILRALSIELRHQLYDPLWRQFWDVSFSLSSFLLAVFFGAALGNVIRGVPIDPDGTFFEPLWTDFRVGLDTGILDIYTVLIGLTAVAALAHHGALWISLKTDGIIKERADGWANVLSAVLLVLTAAATFFSFRVQVNIKQSLSDHPWGIAFAAAALSGLGLSAWFRRRGKNGRAFLSSAVYLYGMMACAALGVYPYVLPARVPERGIRIADAMSNPAALGAALCWWVPGILLASLYFVYVYSRDGRLSGGGKKNSRL